MSAEVEVQRLKQTVEELTKALTLMEKDVKKEFSLVGKLNKKVEKLEQDKTSVSNNEKIQISIAKLAEKIDNIIYRIEELERSNKKEFLNDSSEESYTCEELERRITTLETANNRLHGSMGR